MARLKVVLVLSFLLLGSFIIYKLHNYNEIYINSNYVIRKYNYKYELYNNDNLVLDDYIYSYQLNDDYIGLRVLKSIDNEYKDVYYLIDLSNNYLYGYYTDLDSYLAVQGTFSKEMLGDWIYIDEY